MPATEMNSALLLDGGGGTLLLTCTEVPAGYEMIPNTKTLHVFQFDWKCPHLHITQNRRKHKYSEVGGLF